MEDFKKIPNKLETAITLTDKLNISKLCRICANSSEYLIPIFEGEGMENDLDLKIKKHLPIQVSKDDSLPICVCYQCASTLIAWSELTVKCIEANKRFKSYIDYSCITEHSELLLKENSYLNSIKSSANNSEQGKIQNTLNISDNQVKVKGNLVVEGEINKKGSIVEQNNTSNEKCLTSDKPFKTYHQSNFIFKDTPRTAVFNRIEEIKSGPFLCSNCKEVFLSNSNLQKHIRTAHGQSLFQCEICKITFDTELVFTSHKNNCDKLQDENKTIKEFPGKLGSKSINKRRNFLRHKNIFHDIENKPNKYGKFTCNVCSKSFVKKYHLQFHKESHKCLNEDENYKYDSGSETNNKYSCGLCNKDCSKKYELKSHKIKTGVFDETSNNDLNIQVDSENVCFEKEVQIYEKKIQNCLHQKESFENSNELDNSKDISNNYSDENMSCVSDYSVNSEDISRHLDVPVTTITPQVIMENKSLERQYKCSLCNHAYTRKHDMIKHRRQVHTIEERRKDPFEHDLIKKVKESEKKFSCSQCNNSYSRNSDLRKHMIKSHNAEIYKGRQVDTIDDMDVEILNRAKIEINGTTYYHCEICGKNIITKRGYVRHVRIHTGERPFTCHICGKQYRSSTDLMRHLKCVHDGIKNYQCDVCGRYFANKATRNDHRRIHTGERPYICHTCGKAFPTPNSIYVHRRIHTDYFPHQCTFCDKRFRRRQQLNHHIRTHTGEKPHACDICGKCFGVKDEVSRHRLTHSGEKPFSCPICGLCFGQKRYLSSHTKMHHSGLL
uniref:Zinc finger protein 865 n=1 Tax=Clastoptera arizonana TaxID=38151 RepID=A0A1B6DME8_9HEMI